MPEGIEGEVINDNVAETTKSIQFIIKQNTVTSKFIKHLGRFEINRDAIEEEMMSLIEEGINDINIHFKRVFEMYDNHTARIDS